MNWIILFIAGLFEIAWVIGLKYSDGFTKLWPSLLTLVAMVLSVVLLGLAMKTLPAGTSYAIWTGIGVLGTAVLSIYLFAEPTNIGRMLSFALIVAGIVGLKLTTTTS